jgi:hypothetical protein
LLIRLLLRLLVLPVEETTGQASGSANSRAQASIASHGADERATGRPGCTTSHRALLRLSHAGAPRQRYDENNNNREHKTLHVTLLHK